MLAFRAAATGLVTIETLGCAAGTNAAGVAVAPGGFAPIGKPGAAADTGPANTAR